MIHRKLHTLQDIHTTLRKLPTDQCVLLVDQSIHIHYASFLQALQKALAHKYQLFVSYKIEVNESLKSLDNYAYYTESILKNPLHRKAYIICMGSGTLLDFGGFLAATLLRGLPWISIPTTFLAMIDAGIGGKVGINSQYGKNLIGAFHLPKEVLISTNFLDSLPLPSNASHSSPASTPHSILDNGELIKYGLLCPRIAKAIRHKRPLPDLIMLCARYKADITKKDPKDKDPLLRGQLNLGHTFAHALEIYYSMPHHLAVYTGLIFAGIFFAPHTQNDQAQATMKLSMELSANAFMPSTLSLQETYGRKWCGEDILELCRRDKKRLTSDNLTFVLRTHAGHITHESLSMSEARELMDNLPQRLIRFYDTTLARSIS